MILIVTNKNEVLRGGDIMGKFIAGFVAGVIFSMVVAGTIYPNVAADIMSGEIRSATVDVVKGWFD